MIKTHNLSNQCTIDHFIPPVYGSWIIGVQSIKIGIRLVYWKHLGVAGVFEVEEGVVDVVG